MSNSPIHSDSPSQDAAPPASKDGSVPSGFILKLYQMVNGAPDDIISVSDFHRHLFFRRLKAISTASGSLINTQPICVLSKRTRVHSERLSGFSLILLSLIDARFNITSLPPPPKNIPQRTSFWSRPQIVSLSRSCGLVGCCLCLDLDAIESVSLFRDPFLHRCRPQKAPKSR